MMIASLCLKDESSVHPFGCVIALTFSLFGVCYGTNGYMDIHFILHTRSKSKCLCRVDISCLPEMKLVAVVVLRILLASTSLQPPPSHGIDPISAYVCHDNA
jgi:hypothetical protein